MNAQHQYTCPAARAPTRKLVWPAGALGGQEPREEGEMGGRKTPKIIDYAFSLSKSRLIPNPIDQNPWAHWRSPMDMMRQGWSTSLFHAAQQWSTRSS